MIVGYRYTKSTKKALDLSIKKWEEIAAGTGTDEGSRNCALCKKYNIVVTESPKSVKNCVGCPVAVVSGKQYCVGTPYQMYRHYLVYEHSVPGASMVAAKIMLKFLKTLRAGSKVKRKMRKLKVAPWG